MSYDKIKFNDKDSNYVHADSNLILTDGNVNEIKDVINNLVFYKNVNIFGFSETTRFIGIKIPSDFLNEDSEYSMELLISDSPEFSTVRSKNSINDEGFYVFRKGKFEKFAKFTLEDTQRNNFS